MRERPSSEQTRARKIGSAQVFVVFIEVTGIRASLKSSLHQKCDTDRAGTSSPPKTWARLTPDDAVFVLRQAPALGLADVPAGCFAEFFGAGTR
jgi:hypothetical protein